MARANSMVLNKLACVLLMSMVLGAPLAQAAITCGQVASSLQPCISYLTTGGAVPPACCGGIKSLKAAATTPADRQQACTCLKGAANSISGINYNLAAGIPGQCGVSIPYKISPTTDCTSVN